MPVTVIGQGTYSFCTKTQTGATAWRVTWGGITPASGWYFYTITIYMMDGRHNTFKKTDGYMDFGGESKEPVSVEIEFREYPTYSFNIHASVATKEAKDEGATADCDPSVAEVEPYTDVPVSLEATPQTDNYKFFKWVGGSSNAEIADPTSPNTTVTIHIGSSVSQPDQYFRAQYILIQSVELSVVTLRCEANPTQNVGEAPLTTTVTVYNPDEHCYLLGWGDISKVSDRPNPRTITITNDSLYYVYAYQDLAISTDVVSDKNYGTVTAVGVGRYPFPVFDGGVVDKGLSWWQNGFQTGSYSTNRMRITITDNPAKPANVRYVSADIVYGTYNTQTQEFIAKSIASTKNRYYQIDVNRYTNGGYFDYDKRYVFDMYKIQYHYTELSGGYILYGYNGDLIFGEGGNLLYGLAEEGG